MNSDELRQILRDYLTGSATVEDVSIKAGDLRWDDTIDDLLRSRSADVELIATEVIEGLRSEQELKDEARRLMGDKVPARTS
jgi:hypothetical protein